MLEVDVSSEREPPGAAASSSTACSKLCTRRRASLLARAVRAGCSSVRLSGPTLSAVYEPRVRASELLLRGLSDPLPSSVFSRTSHVPPSLLLQRPRTLVPPLSTPSRQFSRACTAQLPRPSPTRASCTLSAALRPDAPGPRSPISSSPSRLSASRESARVQPGCSPFTLLSRWLSLVGRGERQLSSLRPRARRPSQALALAQALSHTLEGFSAKLHEVSRRDARPLSSSQRGVRGRENERNRGPERGGSTGSSADLDERGRRREGEGGRRNRV